MKKFLSGFLGFVILIGIGWGLIKLFEGIWDSLTSLDTTLSATIITASVTFIIAVITVVLGKYYERRLTIEKELREKKIPIYSEFIEFYIDLFSQKREISTDEMEKYFVKFTKQLIIWGSDDVINKWSKFRVKLVNNQENFSAFSDYEKIKEWMLEFEALLLAIRKDTGTKNSKMNSGDILRMFVNDM